MLSAVQGEVRNSNERELHLWFRFLWDSYKCILDLLRNNPRLEDAYHDTARAAFEFCRENARNLEFRRLSETLRQHTAQYTKASHSHSVTLNNPDTAQRLMVTRFVQMKVASELGM